MPAARNPIYPMVSQIIKDVKDVHGTVRRSIRETSDAGEGAKQLAHDLLLSNENFVDVQIQFIGASGLPRMDIVGTADPYFMAKIDDKVTYISSVQPNTLNPIWNELWCVNNVPDRATLTVEVLDKDEGSLVDDCIGSFETTIRPGTKELQIVSTILKIVKGTFWINITASPTGHPSTAYRYIFDGPIRYSRHYSPTVGHFTRINEERLYSTWKMHIKGVPLFLEDSYQQWNKDYKAAQSIFQGRASLAIRGTIQAAHHMLYARSTRNTFGIIQTREDVLTLLHGGHGAAGHRIKPAVYTYVIASQDDSFRFSETGAAFFVDFASKHALHSNCAENVRYSGEFHPRPVGGWGIFNDEIPDPQIDWELVIDNNSGTYSPDPKMLSKLKALFEYNFPWFTIHTMDFRDPVLVESREACRAYALRYRGVQEQELQPHAPGGEETLLHRAQVNPGVVERPDEQPPT